MLIISGPGVTFTNCEMIHGFNFTGYKRVWSDPTYPAKTEQLFDLSKNNNSLFLGSIGNGIRGRVTVNFKNNNSSVIVDFVQNECVAEGGNPWIDSVNGNINNYYRKPGAFWGQICNVYYIGMNK